MAFTAVNELQLKSSDRLNSIMDKVRQTIDAYLGPYLVVVSQEQSGLLSGSFDHRKVAIGEETALLTQRQAMNQLDAQFEGDQTNSTF